MTWKGWMSFGGTEIINVDRTEAYATKGGFTAFRPVYKNGNLARGMGEDPYSLPLFDGECPWIDPQEPDSFDFFGIYPLDITGLEDSTRVTQTVEFNGEGGSAGRVRHGMRTIVFDMMLLAKDDGGADYGFTWLKSALLAGQGGDCNFTGYDGATMCFLTQEPWGAETDADAEACIDKLMRFMYRATVTNGPVVTSQKQLRSGVMWNVQWTVTVGNPHQFGSPQTVLKDWLVTSNAQPSASELDRTGYIWRNVECPSAAYLPVFDPNCPDLIIPPATPNVPLGCFDKPANWRRRTFTIPATFSRIWTDTVPIIQLKTAPGVPVKGLQIRLYTDPDGTFDDRADPCAYCADILISYIPDNGVLSLDGRLEQVLFSQAGQQRRADSLVTSSRGTPMRWPQLGCGTRYFGTIDALQGQVMPAFSLYTATKVR